MKRHFKVAVVIVRSNQNKKKFLLIGSEGLDGDDFWYFPNDIILPGQRTDDTAVNIVLKQTDIRCRITKEVITTRDSFGTELHFFLAEQIYGRATPLLPCFKEVRWCTKEEIRTLLNDTLPYELWQFLE